MLAFGETPARSRDPRHVRTLVERDGAAILTASILGVAMYVAVSLVKRFALQWDPTRQERGTA